MTPFDFGWIAKHCKSGTTCESIYKFLSNEEIMKRLLRDSCAGGMITWAVQVVRFYLCLDLFGKDPERWTSTKM